MVGYPPPPPGQPGHGYPVPQTNKKAGWSLGLGIAGIVCCGFVTGIPAIILGSRARREITASAGAQTGQGMAIAGLVLGIVTTALSVLSLVLFLAGLLALPDSSTSP